MKNISRKELCEFLGTYCAMYGCQPYYVGKHDPFPVDPDHIFSGLQYDGLTTGRVVHMHVEGAHMKYLSLADVPLKSRYEYSEILRIANVDGMKILQFSPRYLEESRMTSNVHFGEQYKHALEQANIGKIKSMYNLMLEAAKEEKKFFKNDTKKLAKELGMGEYVSDKRLIAALTSATRDIIEQYSYPLWEGESPQFMMSYASYDTILNELYDLTHAKLQLMQDQEHVQNQPEHLSRPGASALEQLVQQAAGDDWMQIDQGNDDQIIERR